VEASVAVAAPRHVLVPSCCGQALFYMRGCTHNAPVLFWESLADVAQLGIRQLFIAAEALFKHDNAVTTPSRYRDTSAWRLIILSSVACIMQLLLLLELPPVRS
jgi:hypothetical protein